MQIPAEAGSDAPVGPPGCDRATYPDPPGVGDGGASLPPLVFALHSIDLGDESAIPGYDLDNVCTCLQDAGVSCVGKSSQPTTYCDEPSGPMNQGIDNQAAKLFGLIKLALGSSLFGSTVFSEEAAQGHWSMLFRVEGYNGLMDDPEVDLAIYPSGGPGTPPSWNGNDVWPVVGTSVDGGVDNPKYLSNGAYVSQGTLVASVPTTELTIHGGNQDTITIRLSAGVITADLVQINGQWHMQHGIVAARWALADVFKALSSFRDSMGLPICTNQASYTIAKQAICSDADILVDGTQPKSAPCDALSMGLGFTADPAVLGGVADAGAPTPGCPPAADPANDSCN